MDLDKRELLLEKRLNDLSNSTIERPVEEKITIRHVKQEAEALPMSPDQYDLRDLTYEARLNVISSNAIVSRLGWKPSKIKSDITREMLADYQAEQFKNVQRGLYLPADLDMDLEPLPIWQAPPISTEYALLKRLTKNDATLKQEKVRLVEAQSQLRLTENLWDVPQERIDDDFTRRIDAVNERIATSEFELSRLQRYLDDFQQYKKDFDLETSLVEKRNASKKKRFAEELKLLNSGRMEIDMRDDETPDEYKQRLRDVGVSTPDEDAVIASASLFYTDVLREKLSELLRDDAEVSNFIKTMTPEDRFELVKNFEPFKKKIQEVFGTSKVSAQQLSKHKQDRSTGTILEDVKNAVLALSLQEQQDEEDALIGKEVENYALGGGKAPFENTLTEAQIGEVSNEIAKAKRTKKITELMHDNLITFVNNPRTPLIRHFGKATDDKIKEYHRFRAHIDNLRGVVHTAEAQVVPNTDEEGKVRASIRRRLNEIEVADPQGQDASLKSEHDELSSILSMGSFDALKRRAQLHSVDLTPFTGSGLKREHAKTVPFGRIMLHPQRLFYDNVLVITGKSGSSITGLSKRKVSDAFVELIFKVLHKQSPTLKDFKTLSESEKKLYDTLVYASGMSKVVEPTGSGIKEELRKRLELVEGEIEAGNNNPALMKEAHHILHNMAQMGMVSRPKAIAHLKQLSHFHR